MISTCKHHTLEELTVDEAGVVVVVVLVVVVVEELDELEVHASQVELGSTEVAGMARAPAAKAATMKDFILIDLVCWFGWNERLGSES